MIATEQEIMLQLQPIVGLKLSVARLAASMRGFHFGRMREVPGGTVGEYALHIQCPWRMEGPNGIVTGSSDLWEPAYDDPDIDWDTWDYDAYGGNLQDRRLAELLGGYDPATRSLVNQTDILMVESVSADTYGGLGITLSGGYELVLFPAGTAGEDWRLLPSHFVVSSGRIE